MPREVCHGGEQFMLHGRSLACSARPKSKKRASRFRRRRWMPSAARRGKANQPFPERSAAFGLKAQQSGRLPLSRIPHRIRLGEPTLRSGLSCPGGKRQPPLTEDGAMTSQYSGCGPVAAQLRSSNATLAGRRGDSARAAAVHFRVWAPGRQNRSRSSLRSASRPLQLRTVTRTAIFRAAPHAKAGDLVSLSTGSIGNALSRSGFALPT